MGKTDTDVRNTCAVELCAARSDHGSTNAMQAPEPNPASSGYDSDHELSGAVAPEVNSNPKPSKVVGQAKYYQDAHRLAAQPLRAGPMHPGASADPVLNWEH